MKKITFLPGVNKYEIQGETVYAEYIGRQKGFECCVCGKGCNAYTFNILHGVIGPGPAKDPFEDLGRNKPGRPEGHIAADAQLPGRWMAA